MNCPFSYSEQKQYDVNGFKRQTITSQAPCMEENCGFWDDDVSLCGVLSIAKSLNRLSNVDFWIRVIEKGLINYNELTK